MVTQIVTLHIQAVFIVLSETDCLPQLTHLHNSALYLRIYRVSCLLYGRCCLLLLRRLNFLLL